MFPLSLTVNISDNRIHVIYLLDSLLQENEDLVMKAENG